MAAFLKKYETFMVTVLMVMMAFILFLATVDLAWIIFESVTTPPYLYISVDRLLELFGQFMLVIIGVELLETIMRTYMAHREYRHEVVMSVAIIAIARKVIILDIKEVDTFALLGIAAIILALTVGFFFMKKASSMPSVPPTPPEDKSQ